MVFSLFFGLLWGEYEYEKSYLSDRVSSAVVTQLQQDLFRMRSVVDSAIATQDMARIEQEVALLATDQSMMVYVLLDSSGHIRFANHVIWRDSNAKNVLEAYSTKYHHSAVTQDKPIINISLERLSIQVYYPVHSGSRFRYSAAIDAIYLEYSISNLLFEAVDLLQHRMKIIWGTGSFVILLFCFGLYRLLISPLRRLSRAARQVGDAEFQSHLPFFSSELRSLHYFLNDVDGKLKRANVRLNDAERRWLFSVEGARNGIWDWNVATGSVFVSDRWKEIIGFTAADTADDYLAWETRLHPDEKAQVLNTLQNYINHQKDDYESVHKLRHKDGHYIWVLDKGKIVEWDETGRPIRIIGTITDVSGDVQHHRISVDKQSHNGLTDLINRDALADELFDQQVICRQKQDKAALLLISLENFSVISDTLGQQLSDRLLMQIAARLSSTFSSAGLIARLGADEFVIIANHLGQDLEQANRRALALASEVKQLISRGFTVSDQHLSISANLGGVVFDGIESVEPQVLLSRADIALTQAKEGGNSGCTLYQASMEQNPLQPAKLQQALLNAIDLKQLSIVYQPVVDNLGNLGSIEALLRWYHPDYGFINPKKIISIAETSDGLPKLEFWVFEQVCILLQAIAKSGLKAPICSVNISSRSFHQADFVQRVMDRLNQYQISPQLIQFELAEDVFSVNTEGAKLTLAQLQGIGLSIALDNFGTSMGTLQYLQGICFSQVKLAPRYIVGIVDSEEINKLLAAIIHMATSLGYPIVAKNIEDKATLKLLSNMQCNWFQGYIISRPLSEKDLLQLIQSKLSLNVG
jgi:diguanylate cyclase (GGDEF)-like protein/PAS domain S-box-containing protein